MSEISEKIHRGCIHLYVFLDVGRNMDINNVGLTLLSRHYYTEALEVMRGAVLIAEQSIRLGFESGVIPVHDFLGTKLERAAKLLSASQGASPLGSVTIHEVSDDNIYVPLIIDDSETFYIVRIDYDFNDQDTRYNESIHCATILINLGVAYMICAKISGRPATVCKYQPAALGLWNLANKIFVLHHQILVASPKALLVGLFLYRVLIPSLYQAGRLEEARVCSLRLDQTVRHLSVWRNVCANVQDVAPAA